jgi:hypothetical protein
MDSTVGHFNTCVIKVTFFLGTHGIFLKQFIANYLAMKFRAFVTP